RRGPAGGFARPGPGAVPPAGQARHGRDGGGSAAEERMSESSAQGGTAAAGGLATVDGVPLKQALARAQRRSRWRAFLLVAPLLLFILVSFVVPIGQMLLRSVHNA